MKVLFLVPYPIGEAPSQRFRFEQYLPILKQHNITVDLQSFFSSNQWRFFFEPGHLLAKSAVLLKGYLRRLLWLHKVTAYDFVFVHREATPLGPPVIEWLIARVFRKKLIYDFDDAIWMTDKVSESKVIRMLRGREKVKSICAWAYKVSCGNEYLCDYARQFNPSVIYNPTTVDTELTHNRLNINEAKRMSPTVSIGWTGSRSTLKYLKPLVPVLENIVARFPFVRFVVIADKPTEFAIPNTSFVPWREETEIADLAQLDIGVMPLPDDAWSKGKCGFKAIQYMSLKIPTVASPVGVNVRIISDGIDGFLCDTEDAWIRRLSELVVNEKLRKQLGEVGREKIEANYSVRSNTSNFLQLFT